MKHRILIFALVFFMAGQSFSQENFNLTLKGAQDQALEHNRTLKNASLEIQKAEAARWQTLASMLPQVNVNLDYSNFMGYEINFGAMPIPMNPSGNLTAQVAVALSGAQLVGTQLSEIATKMAEINFKKTEQDIVNQVKTLR